jgi:antitoxin component YwqK of YwqJK toxin-antitoxin module
MIKVIYSSLLVFLFTIGSFAQEDINQKNAKGERIGVWKKYYQNQRIRYEGQFENGKEVGVFKYYSAADSKFPKAIKTFDKNSSEALVQYYTLKGLPESEGKMNGKKRIGKWKYYHKDGKTQMLEENYIDGVLEGEFKVFYEDGKLTKLAHFKDGKLHGNSKKYSPKSILVEDVNYVNGEMHGPAAFYEDNGNLKQKGMYEEDLKVGQWEFFEDGKLSETKEVKVWKEKED